MGHTHYTFSMNPKLMGVYLIQLAKDAFPHRTQRHMFMYRHATKVIESFASIMRGNGTCGVALLCALYGAIGGGLTWFGILYHASDVCPH